jgi:hypothetical protein
MSAPTSILFSDLLVIFTECQSRKTEQECTVDERCHQRSCPRSASSLPYCFLTLCALMVIAVPDSVSGDALTVCTVLSSDVYNDVYEGPR